MFYEVFFSSIEKKPCCHRATLANISRLLWEEEVGMEDKYNLRGLRPFMLHDYTRFAESLFSNEPWSM